MWFVLLFVSCCLRRYDAGEEHGRQVAKKGVRFLKFPPVLNVHLKRFEYEMTTGSMVKVNDRYSFPREMDIDQYLGEVRAGCVVVCLLFCVVLKGAPLFFIFGVTA